MLTFIVDYSRKVLLFLLKHKDFFFMNFKQWKIILRSKLVDTSGSCEPIISKFCSGEFNDFLNKEGIVKHLRLVGRP